MKIAYLHGLNSSCAVFTYLVQQLPKHEVYLINYSSHQPLEYSLQEVKKQLPKGRITIIGHSLGGVIGTLLAAEQNSYIKKLVTISSPIHGSAAASTLRWLLQFIPVLNDITPDSPLIIKCCNLELKVPTLSIISTAGGTTSLSEPNDSVVTIESQKALRFGSKIEVQEDHYEILRSIRTAQLLEEFLF